MNPSPPAGLRQFQDSYSRHLRSPEASSLAKDIPMRRSKVYEELLFNNVCGFLDRCFPVARSLMTQEAWRTLNRDFYRDWQCHTPYFSQIPAEFVQYMRQLADTKDLGDWFVELLDYEWRELKVDVHPHKVPRIHLPVDQNYVLQTNPTLQNLQYQWPVHQISKDSLPQQPRPTFLLVYRSFDHRVQFMEINAVTSMLLQILQQQPAHPRHAISALADLIPDANRESLHQFGEPLLLDLLHKNALVITT